MVERTAFVRTLCGATRVLRLPAAAACKDPAGDLCEAVSALCGVPSSELRLRVVVSGGEDLFVRVGLRLCGGKQGAFGQNLRRGLQQQRRRRPRDLDACRTLDGRRLSTARAEERLSAWAAAAAERRAREDAAAAAAADARRRRAEAAAAAAVARVDRDAAATMADAVAEGLRSAAAAKKKKRPRSEEEEEKEEEEEGEEEEEEEDDDDECRTARGKGVERHAHALVLLEQSPYGPQTPWICDACGKRGFGPVMHCPEASCAFDLCRACNSACTAATKQL